MYRASFIVYVTTNKYKVIFHNEPNSLYTLANITKQHVTQPDIHPDSVHARLAHSQHQKGASPSLNIYNKSTI